MHEYVVRGTEESIFMHSQNRNTIMHHLPENKFSTKVNLPDARVLMQNVQKIKCPNDAIACCFEA